MMKYKSLELSSNAENHLSEFENINEIPPPQLLYLNGTLSFTNRGLLEVNWSNSKIAYTQVMLKDERSQAQVFEEQTTSSYCIISGLTPNRNYQLYLRTISMGQKEVSSWVECTIRVG